MSNHDERFAEIEKTWFDADGNYEDDHNNASAADKAKVTANRNAAYTAYIAAFHSVLTKHGNDVESIYKNLVSANKAIKKARADLEKIPKLLGMLAKATEKASDLVVKAKT